MISIIRQSGLPISFDGWEKKTKWNREQHDKKKEEIGKFCKENKEKWQSFYKELVKEEEELFSCKEMIEFPQSKEEWNKLIEEYGGHPIIIGNDKEGTLHLMIYDMMNNAEDLENE